MNCTRIGKTIRANISPEAIIAATKVIETLESRDERITKSLLLLLGIYIHPDRSSQIHMLDWSPVKKAIRIAGMTQDEVLQLGKKWVRTKFSDALTDFHEFALDTQRRDFNKPCLHFIMRGEYRVVLLLMQI